MIKISAVIITYNESINIARCINSIKTVVDEIIISDSNSTDDTTIIAQQLGAKVIVKGFDGYGKTKNFANNTATHNWILSIDADEALDDELAKSILKYKNKLNQNTVYEFKRLNNYCGTWIKHGGWYPDKKTRLFNKSNVNWNLAEVHETLDVPANFNIVLLPGKLLHYSYLTVESHLAKIEKYSTRGAEELFKKGKKTSWVKLYLSPTFRFIRDYLIKLGFLDGAYGFLIAKLTAKEVYLKYQKLKVLTSKA